MEPSVTNAGIITSVMNIVIFQVSGHKFHDFYNFSRICMNPGFNGHFPDEPGLASVYWSKGWWRWWWQLDNWSYTSCKAPVKLSPPTNQHPVFLTARMPFLSPNQQCQSTEGKISHSMDLLTPSSPGVLLTLSLTTNSSWLPWGRVAMPLISPLMPVPQVFIYFSAALDLCMSYSSSFTAISITFSSNKIQKGDIW